MVVVAVQAPASGRLTPADPAVLAAVQRHVLLVGELEGGHVLRAAWRRAWLAAAVALAKPLEVGGHALASVGDAPADPVGVAFQRRTFVA